MLFRRSDTVALTQLRAAGHRTGMKDGLLSPAEAASRLGVPEHRVRQYCEEGLLACIRLRGDSRARLRLKPEVVGAFTPPAGDVIEAMPISEVVRASGRSRDFVDREIERGFLAAVQSSGGCRLVLPSAYRAWVASAPRTRVPAAVPATDAGLVSRNSGRLTISAAASLLGLSAKQVRGLAARGVLDDHRADGSGWRWFEAGDVEELAKAADPTGKAGRPGPSS